MITRIIVLFAASVVSGLWWECGSDIGLIFNVAGRPIALAVLVAILWPTASFKKTALFVIAAVFASNVIANLTYALQTDPWYVTSDSETQLWIVVSFAIQTGVTLITLFVVKKIKGILNKE